MRLVDTINDIIAGQLDYIENNPDAAEEYRVLDGWDKDDTTIEVGYATCPPDSYIDSASAGEIEIQLPDEIESFFRRHPQAATLIGRRIDGYLCERNLLVYVATDIVYYLV